MRERGGLRAARGDPLPLVRCVLRGWWRRNGTRGWRWESGRGEGIDRLGLGCVLGGLAGPAWQKKWAEEKEGKRPTQLEIVELISIVQKEKKGEEEEDKRKYLRVQIFSN